MVSPIVAIKNGIRYCRTCDIKGRSPRSEFWWFTLFTWFSFILFFLICTPIIEATNSDLIAIPVIILLLVCLYCNQVIDVRRFHDTNTHAGLLIFLKAFIIILIIAKQLIGSLAFQISFDDRLAIRGVISLLSLLTILGLLVIYCTRGTKGPNRYGPDPLAPKSETVSDSNTSDIAQQN